jgi:hypothetical protein
MFSVPNILVGTLFSCRKATIKQAILRQKTKKETVTYIYVTYFVEIWIPELMDFLWGEVEEREGMWATHLGSIALLQSSQISIISASLSFSSL